MVDETEERSLFHTWGLFGGAATALQSTLQSRPYGPGGASDPTLQPLYRPLQDTTRRAGLLPRQIPVYAGSCTTHRAQPQGDNQMTQKYEAYLGPNEPGTLASGWGEPGVEYAVVHEDYTSYATSWVGAYADEQSAMKAVQAATTHRGFGVLCRVREARPTEYTFTNGIPVVKGPANV